MASMLTTIDNPHDPRLDFFAWFNWDEQQGYHTCAYLARIAFVAEEFPEEVRLRHIEQAIDEIVELNGGLYTKLNVPIAA